MKSFNEKNLVQKKKTFISDAIDMVSMGVHSFERDSFNECFKPYPRSRLYNSGILYIFSFITRYFILFPMRFLILVCGIGAISVVFSFGMLYQNKMIIGIAFKMFFKLIICVFNCYIKHHGEKKKIDGPHIYVANHTSGLDYILLSSHKFYHACVSEGHGGFFGFIFNSFICKNGSIAFKRNVENERKMTLNRLKEYILTKGAPMVIFPEGTCVNNEYIVLFQKGVFELDATICPVGIRYHKGIADPYWNRKKQSFLMHLFYLITRWRIDSDIYWLDPITRGKNESYFEFAHRTKNMIAEKTKLKNVLWDGMFKSSPKFKNRQALKMAFKMVYLKIKNGKLEKDVENNLSNNNFLNENIATIIKRNVLLFDKITYADFITELTKEYLRIKSLSKIIMPII